MSHQSKAKAKCFLALVASLLSHSAGATEGGGSVYPYGLNTVAIGVLPKPGLYLYNYNSYYDADVTRNNAGGCALPKFHARITANSLRLLYSFESIRLLNGNFAWAFAQPYVNGHIETPFASGKKGALSDITTGPMIGWHSPTWHSIAGLDFTLPTGEYDKKNVFNPGRNQYAVTPYYNFTWVVANNVDVNMRANLTFNGKNDETNYRSGTELGADYAINYNFTSGWFVALSDRLSDFLSQYFL